MNYVPIIEAKRTRFADLEDIIGRPNFFEDAKKAGELLREHRGLQKLLTCWDQYQKAQTELADSRELAKSLNDKELAEMAAEEIPSLEQRLVDLEKTIQESILPPDPLEGRDVIMEFRAGTGGDEAAIFAGDLLRMYTRFAENRGWKVETLESSPSDMGGVKEASIKISGEDVYRVLKYESGVHRVQRVPATEAQGRIHTSAVTVAILPEMDEVEDIEINPADLRIDTFRASGAGGQHVNKTDSAVRMTHLPTGIVVECQDERSQHKNRSRAMSLLKAKLLASEREKRDAAQARTRKLQVGSGDRSERIRTYNFPQGRVTDHRINLTLYQLEQIIEGRLDDLIEPLMQEYQSELLAEEEA